MKSENHLSRPSRLKSIQKFFVLFTITFSSVWVLLDPLDPFGLDLLKRLHLWGYVGLILIAIFITLIILHFFKEKPRLTISKIETVLKKDAISEPVYFRKTGPLWVDFEKGYILKRDEVDEIINQLAKEPQQLISGGPASGKSVLLKKIGFDLAGSGYSVFYIDCIYESEEHVLNYFRECIQVDDSKTLIIIDNCHHQKSNCRFFTEQFRNQGISKTKMLFGSRPIAPLGKYADIFNEVCVTELKAADIAEKLVRFYLDRVHKVNDNKRVENAIAQLKKYTHDLWWLSIALDTYDINSGMVSKKDIYLHEKRQIAVYSQDEDNPIGAEDVLLPLCTFFRFELPLEKRFLTKELLIDRKWINKLIGLSEIVNNEKEGSWEVLNLFHSSRAFFLYDLFRSNDFLGFGANIKDVIIEKSGATSWEEGLFKIYLTSKITDHFTLIDVLNEYLSFMVPVDFDEEEDTSSKEPDQLQRLLIKVFGNEEVSNSLKSELEKEDDEYFQEKTREILLLFAQLDIELSFKWAKSCVLPRFIDYDLKDIIFYVRELTEHSTAELILPFIDLILSKVNTPLDLEIIGNYIGEWTDPTDFPDRDDIFEVGFKISPKIVDHIIKKVKQEKNSPEIEAWLNNTEELIGLGTAEKVSTRIRLMENLTSTEISI